MKSKVVFRATVITSVRCWCCRASMPVSGLEEAEAWCIQRNAEAGCDEFYVEPGVVLRVEDAPK